MTDLMYWIVVTAVAVIHMIFGAFVYHLMFIEDIVWFWQDDKKDSDHSINANEMTDKIMYIDEHTQTDEEFFKEFTVEVFKDFGWDYYVKQELDHAVNCMDITEPKWK